MDTNNYNESQAREGSGMSGKRLYYIIGGIVILVVIGLYVSGMFGRNAADQAYKDATGGDVTYDADGQATYTTDQGAVTVGGNSLPENWPSDAPQYPGAQYSYSASSNIGTEGAGVAFQVRATTQEVMDFYKRELVAKGWVIQGTATMASATTLTATKDKRSFGLYIADTGNGMVNATVAIGGM